MRDLIVRTASHNALPWEAAGQALRRAFVALAVLAGVAFGHASSAAAQTAAELPSLRILEYGAGKRIFDGLIPAMNESAGSQVPVDVTDNISLDAFMAFCPLIATRGPDILLSSRRIFPDTAANCARNDAQPLAEIELGRGALVLAVRKGSALSQLTSRQVYLALARDVPYRDEFHRNASIRWSDIDRSLPAQDIRFQLPPRKSGDRVAFDFLVLEAGCRTEPMVKLIFSAQSRTARCVTTRIDRVREVAREQALQELLEAPEGSVGLVGFSDVVRSGGALVALALDGVEPTAETIVDGSYNLSGSIWLYARRGQPGSTPAEDAAISRIIAGASM